jgi:hypothetical protein
MVVTVQHELCPMTLEHPFEIGCIAERAAQRRLPG